MERKFNIMNKYYIRIIIALISMIIAGYVFLTNIRFSIEFTGGMELLINEELQEEDKSQLSSELTNKLDNEGFENINIGISKQDEFLSLLFQLNVGDDDKVNKLSDIVKNHLIDNGYINGKEDIVEKVIIGPSVGKYMKNSAITALGVGLLLIIIYMFFAFSGVRNYISPGILALITLFTLLFDVLIPGGAYGLLMFFNETAQINMIFVVAILTIIGYSINDTIVVFDRVRENFGMKDNKLKEGKITSQEIYEMSIWQTMRRSIATSLSTFLVLIAMFIFGTGLLKIFAFTLMIGVLAGTFSSLFLAAPLAYIFNKQFYNN